MKLITALVRPTAYQRLSTALRKARVSGITVSRVEGYGKEHLSADVDLFGHLNPKVKVEVAVDDDLCRDIVDLIKNSIEENKKDSGGTIFIQSLDSVEKIQKS